MEDCPKTASVKEPNENKGEPGKYTIFSDAQGVLQALKWNACNYPMVDEIQLLLYQNSIKEINTSLCWVLGHSGVERNKDANALVKSATTNINRLCQQE